MPLMHVRGTCHGNHPWEPEAPGLHEGTSGMRGKGGLLLLQSATPLMTHHQSLLSPSIFSAAAADSLRRAPSAAMSTVTGATDVLQQKFALRAKIRRDLKAFSPAQRAQEDIAIQNIVLDSSWFKSCERLCAYISCESLREVDTSRILREVLRNTDADHPTQVKKKLFVPRVEDKNSHMRMLNISSMEDLVANSMNILEPSATNADGSQREDVMLANDPVDILLLPGVAFDRHGRRLGRGGGYYDVFLKKYQDLVMERKWKQPLLVALAYSAQIMEEGVVPVTSTDFPVDAVISPSGVIPISSAALANI